MSAQRDHFSLSHYARQLGGEVELDGSILCPGPGHSRGDRSLSVRFADDGSFRVHSFANDDWQSCKDHVRQLCGLGDFRPGPRLVERPDAGYRESKNERIEEVAARQKLAALIRRIWDEAVDPRGTIVERYLKARGIHCLDLAAGHAIRFHPDVLFDKVWRPAMIARYTPIVDGDVGLPPTAIHRTALYEDRLGHAGKRMLGPVIGQAVRLDPGAPVGDLNIAEGIETALAVAQHGNRPIWAMTTANAIAAFPVLPTLNRLTIFADHDKAGQSAAQDCVDRWREAYRRHRDNERVTIILPKLGRDFADRQDDDE